MHKVLITGCTGFVGKALVASLVKKYTLILPTRRNLKEIPNTVIFLIKNLDADTDWTQALTGVDVVVHLAARVHIMNDMSEDPLTEFRKVNVDATLNLARQAAQLGVKRFIFVSSIKVNGESTVKGRPFAADDAPNPLDAYGISKMEAEAQLKVLADKTTMKFVIIRPPLVYGPGVKANFLNMMVWLNKRIPLPLGAIGNKRSFVSVENLVDLIGVCILHPAAENQIFLVSDDEDLSTTELLQRMGKALAKPVLLVPVPVFLLKLLGKMLGKADVIQRLCESLQVDITKTKKLLMWTPPTSVDESLSKTARCFYDEKTI